MLGVTAMLTRLGLLTVRVLVADKPPELALMIAFPEATPAARPLLLTVANAGLLLDH